MKSLAVIIHARTQSTRCPNKHLRDYGDGNTLIDTAINNLSSLVVDEKYLAVGEKILSNRVKGDIKILHRDFDSVKKGNPPMNVFYKHLESVKSDYICNYNPCQPFLKVDEIQKVIDFFIRSNWDSMITVKKEKNFFWSNDLKPVNFVEGDRLSTIDGPHLFVATHSLVFYKKDYILKNWQYFSNKVNDPFPYEVMWDEKNLIDVDTEVDFELVRSFYEKK
jgi:CMP-N-acetylneuraminic acid synthetase|tara:strand:+ start:14761 stop:15423 length:663 start_codon:yes stop_codon:yes gene_type:complete